MCEAKTILITGGTGKLGTQFVKYFLENNFLVIFTSRSRAKINSFYKQFNENYKQNKFYGIAVDLENEDASKQVIDFLDKKDLWPECIINNARNKDYLKVGQNFMPGRKEWIGEFLIDVVAPCELILSLVNHEKGKVNNIVNIASIYGIVPPNPNLYNDQEVASPIQYGVAKAALIHLTKELAIRLAGKNIRVNSISYGGVEGGVSEDFQKRYSKFCPRGNMLTFDDITGALHFLVSSKSSGMTGHNLVVDGGWCVW